MIKTCVAIMASLALTQANYFFDNFANLDTSKWTTFMEDTGTFSTGPKGLNLQIEKAKIEAYSNSAFVSNQAFSQQTFKATVTPTPTSKGSRGWGFWNGKMDPSQSTIAWFIYLEGETNYILNGFWAVVQAPGNYPEFYPLDRNFLNEKNEYSIEWTDKFVFKINNNIVAQSSTKIETPLEIHLWQDNAVYDPTTFGPRLQNVEELSTLQINQVSVGEEPPSLAAKHETLLEN